MRSTRHTRGRGLLALALALLLVAAACGSDDKSEGSSETSKPSGGSEKVLGAAKPAKGEPVRIGFLSNGTSATINNQIEIDVAEATVKWANQHLGGIGGRPIDLVVCTDEGDAGKAGDCANELISKDVVATVIASSATVEAQWKPLHDAGIPVVAFGPTKTLMEDDTSTFTASPPIKVVLLGLPVAAARELGKKKISAMVIDVPAATENFENAKPELAKQGITMNIVRIAIGTPDMSPQAEQIMRGGDPGVLSVIGNDTFCIAAFNALKGAGYEGPVATATSCVSDATRKAVPGSFLKQVRLTSQAPIGDTSSESYKLFKAVTDTYAGKDVDLTRANGWNAFITMNILLFGTEGITGEVTTTSIIKTMKSMPLRELPGAGGLHFRCNGKVDPARPATCVPGTLEARLDASGQPSAYKVVSDDAVPD